MLSSKDFRTIELFGNRTKGGDILISRGNVKVYGDIKLNEDVEKHFTNGDDKGKWLAINSGTIELKENKVIVLAD